MDAPDNFVARLRTTSGGGLEIGALVEAGGNFTRTVTTQHQRTPEGGRTGWYNEGSPTTITTSGDTPELYTAWEIERIAGHKIPKLPGNIGGADIV